MNDKVGTGNMYVTVAIVAKDATVVVNVIALAASAVGLVILAIKQPPLYLKMNPQERMHACLYND